MTSAMKAIAITPKVPNSDRLISLPVPRVEDVAGGRGVLVRVVRVGVDGTDREIQAGEYGEPPPGDDYLVLGHENFGRVEAVGPEVHHVAPGDFVVATVRRPGHSLYDRIGTSDMTTDDRYYERGINLRHGFLTERYVEDARFVVHVPGGLADCGVLLEPMSILQKGVTQAWEIQRRLRVWRPERAFVLGAGSIGLLATLVLRLRGLRVTVFGRTPRPYLNSDLAEALGATYVTTGDVRLAEGARRFGPPDLILEATGYSPLAFEAMEALGKNGVLVLASVTGGDRQATVPSDRINLGFVLGNKVAVGTVNANRSYFESGVRDLALAQARWPGWPVRLITHRVPGLEQYKELFRLLNEAHDAIKICCEVAAP